MSLNSKIEIKDFSFEKDTKLNIDGNYNTNESTSTNDEETNIIIYDEYDELNEYDVHKRDFYDTNQNLDTYTNEDLSENDETNNIVEYNEDGEANEYDIYKRDFPQSLSSYQKLNKNRNAYDSSQETLYSTINDFKFLEKKESIQVNCNSYIGQLFKKKFGSGGKGSCIRVKMESKSNRDISNNIKKEEKWMTPIEFENYSGKGNCRDWKRTIKVGGQSLASLMANNILVCHAVSCSCAACNKNESLVGPIRPFLRYRRRKKDEIIAQNAFKKFLSLKPPSLLQNSMTKVTRSQNKNGYKDQMIQSELDSTHKSLINSMLTTSTFSEISDMDSKKYERTTSDSLSPSNKKIENRKEILKKDQDFAACLEEFEEIEEEKWSSLEQESKKLILQVQTLQKLIENTRKQSEENRKILIKKFSQYE